MCRLKNVLRSSGRHTRGGFSLIEIMVATAILIMIVVMMSTIFHQSSVAWDAGMRKTQGAMVARAVLGLVARELSQAVPNPDPNNLTMDIRDDRGTIRFVTLSGTNSTRFRIARELQYNFNSGAGTITRTERKLRATGLSAGDYGDPAADSVSIVATNLDDSWGLRFYTSDGADHGDTHADQNLPEWVQIIVGMKRSEDVSGVGARSAGEDRAFDTDDDITSW